VTFTLIESRRPGLRLDAGYCGGGLAGRPTKVPLPLARVFRADRHPPGGGGNAGELRGMGTRPPSIVVLGIDCVMIVATTAYRACAWLGAAVGAARREP
jgi:hypothetical protein